LPTGEFYHNTLSCQDFFRNSAEMDELKQRQAAAAKHLYPT